MMSIRDSFKKKNQKQDQFLGSSGRRARVGKSTAKFVRDAQAQWKFDSLELKRYEYEYYII